MMDSGILSRFRDPPFLADWKIGSDVSSLGKAKHPVENGFQNQGRKRGRGGTIEEDTRSSPTDKTINELLSTSPTNLKNDSTWIHSQKSFQLQYKALRVPPPEAPAPIVSVDFGSSKVYYGEMKSPSPLFFQRTGSAAKLEQVYLAPTNFFQNVKAPGLNNLKVKANVDTKPCQSLPSLREERIAPIMAESSPNSPREHSSLTNPSHKIEKNNIDMAELETKLAGPVRKLFANKTRLHDFVSDTSCGQRLEVVDVINMILKLGIEINELEAEAIGNFAPV
jgi:hypothetical protein